MQVPEILEGIGVAVTAGTAVTDQNFTHDVKELSHQYRGSFIMLAEAEHRFFSAHVTFNCVIDGPNTASELRRFSADVHMLVDHIRGAGQHSAQVAHCGGHHAVASKAQTWSHGHQGPGGVLGGRNSRRTPVERRRSVRRICWDALCRLLPTSCKIGARGTCNGKHMVRKANQERATASAYASGVLGFLHGRVTAVSPIRLQRGCR